MFEELERLNNWELFKHATRSGEITPESLEASRILSHRASLGRSLEAEKLVANIEGRLQKPNYLERGEENEDIRK